MHGSCGIRLRVYLQLHNFVDAKSPDYCSARLTYLVQTNLAFLKATPANAEYQSFTLRYSLLRLFLRRLAFRELILGGLVIRRVVVRRVVVRRIASRGVVSCRLVTCWLVAEVFGVRQGYRTNYGLVKRDRNAETL
jgi:hypothetical protein